MLILLRQEESGAKLLLELIYFFDFGTYNTPNYFCTFFPTESPAWIRPLFLYFYVSSLFDASTIPFFIESIENGSM